MKTNLGLVEYAKKALNEKWGYVWGTYGQVLTPSLLQSKINQYPSQVGNYQNTIRQKWLNKKTADCIGLIKAYMWDKNGKITYNPSTDVNTGMMYNRAKEKGSINTMPEIPGIAIYKQGHIGVYVGDGQVIEAHNTSKGVIKTPLKGAGSTAWTHWLKVPYIEYELTLNEAIEYLQKNGYMDSPDYWRQNAVKGKLVKGDIASFIIIKWAKSLMEKK